MNPTRDQFLADAELAFRATFPDRWESLLRSAERAWAAPIPRESRDFPRCRTVRVRNMTVELHELTIRYIHAHTLETGPHWLNALGQARRLRTRARAGVLILGLDELDRISERRDIEEWSAGEVATASLHTYGTELDLIWLQECGTDPFRRLEEIAADLDWNAHARNVPPED